MNANWCKVGSRAPEPTRQILAQYSFIGEYRVVGFQGLGVEGFRVRGFRVYWCVVGNIGMYRVCGLGVSRKHGIHCMRIIIQGSYSLIA